MYASQVILIAFFTSVVTTGATMYFGERLDGQAGTARRGEVIVPNLKGLSEADARTNLAAAGLIPLLGSAKASENVEPHQVAEQIPGAGMAVEKGSAVTLALAAPPPEVPDVLGRTADQARAALTRAGFDVEFGDRVPHGTIAEGAVATQVPKASEKAKPGARVLLRLSSGPDEVVVPKVTGLTLANAKKALDEAGLELGDVNWVYDEELYPNAIVRQDPTPETKQAPGTRVNIAVNRE